ncbi:MAG: metalloregulator ArsR/SmtB family transcription factor [Methylobacteriaceae bacterium]|nr:metalloregulator ArsR/SmtB family transcription factor [Methylobacteriaceae bacterium]
MDPLSDVLTAISHPTRRAIIGQLANGPARFLDVAKLFDTALNAVTKHLKLLERAGLIERRKQGREVSISFRGERLREVAGWVNEYERFWNERLDQFERYFEDRKEKVKEMTTASTRTVEVKVERTIPAPPSEVFDAWLDPKIPGTPWHENNKLIVNAKVDGLWYWLSSGGTPHYGRFVEIDRPGRIRHSWMSPNTLGEESMVAVTFQKKGEGTLMILRHSGLPNDDMAKAHDKGWNSIFDRFESIFVRGK